MPMFSSRMGRTQIRFSSRKVLRTIILCLVLLAILPPIFFHFRLRRINQMQLRKCGWLNDPPLVCAHGGDSSKAFPNTTEFCLLSMTGRDLQRLSGNTTSKVGYVSSKEIRELGAARHSVERFHDESIPTIQDALMLTANSVRQIILDVKVGPPFYERGLAEDILSIVEKTECRNCLIWAKSDNLARDVIKLSSEITVGYIVMREHSTGARTNLLRMKGAEVVGVYHPLIDEKLMRVLHRRNKKVYAWTVDDEESMQKVLFEHVDAIVTGNPTLLQRLMQDTGIQCLEDGYSLPN